MWLCTRSWDRRELGLGCAGDAGVALGLVATISALRPVEQQLAGSKIRHCPVIVHRCAFIEKSLLRCVWLVSSWDPDWRHREPGVKDTLWVTSGGTGGS